MTNQQREEKIKGLCVRFYEDKYFDSYDIETLFSFLPAWINFEGYSYELLIGKQHLSGIYRAIYKDPKNKKLNLVSGHGQTLRELLLSIIENCVCGYEEIGKQIKLPFKIFYREPTKKEIINYKKPFNH